ncbi:dihydropyrimidinase, partial [Paraburkholderia sp. SIMBA_030]
LRVRIANASLHHAVDYTPYEGIEVTGWPRHCLSRVELLVEDGRLLAAEPGRGQFVPAGKPCLD